MDEGRLSSVRSRLGRQEAIAAVFLAVAGVATFVFLSRNATDDTGDLVQAQQDVSPVSTGSSGSSERIEGGDDQDIPAPIADPPEPQQAPEDPSPPTSQAEIEMDPGPMLLSNLKCSFGDVVTNIGYQGTLWEVNLTWDYQGPPVASYEVTTRWADPDLEGSSYATQDGSYRLLVNNRFPPEIIDTLTAIAEDGEAVTEPVLDCDESPRPRQPVLAANPAAPEAGQAIDFAVVPSSTTEQVSWEWDFGDNSTSTLETPTHAYADPGAYQVQVTVFSKQLGGIEGFEIISHEIIVGP